MLDNIKRLKDKKRMKIIRDSINTYDVEENEENKNIEFNLEYRKIINTKDINSKFTSELKSLTDFIIERSKYRDLNGNRITPRGEFMPTPYQKLEHINKKIRNYYFNKRKSKRIPLIVKNTRNELVDNKLNLSERQKNKSKNYFSLKKYEKSLEKPSFSKILNSSKYSKKNEASLSFNSNIMKLNSSNKKSMSETAYHKKYKLLNKKPASLNKFYNRDNRNNIYEKNSKYTSYITEFNKINKEILYNLTLKPKINDDIIHILNSNAKQSDKLINKSKTKNYINEIDKYKLKQFNNKNKSRDRLLLNDTQLKENFMNKIIMKNNTNINNNIYNINSFRANKNLTLKNMVINNNNKSLENIDKINNSYSKDMNKYKTYKNFGIHNIVFFDDNKLL